MEVKWVVNNRAELGVYVQGNYYWLYKGASIQYPTGRDEDGFKLYVREVGITEFGESCHPLEMVRNNWIMAYDITNPKHGLQYYDEVHRKVLPVPYGGWRPLARATPWQQLKLMPARIKYWYKKWMHRLG